MSKITGVQGNIYFEDGIRKSSFGIEGGKIVPELSPDNILSIPDNLILVPGFIDEHIHGAAGADAMDAKEESLSTIAASLPQEGVTSFLATTMSMDAPHIEAALKAIAEYRAHEHSGARIIGAHLEGPFISKIHCGAQDPNNIIPFNKDLFMKFYEDSNECIKEVTFAYEENGEEALKVFSSLHIRGSIGHSDATSAEFIKALGEGLKCSTHTFNAMRGFHHREAGIVGEALLHDGFNCELIADTIHVSPEAMKLFFKCKKKEDVVLISDSTEGKYLPAGEYELGGQKVFIYDGVARLKDGTIAGSILHLNNALKNVREVAPNLSFTDLIDLVTKNPAKNIGAYNEVGSIAPNKNADFVLIDKDFNVKLTVIGGDIAFKAD